MPNLLKTSYYLPLQVTIDDREPATLEEEFRKMGNMIICRKRMLAGDYLFDEEVLVERKTIPDFCRSIKDGRLFKQVKELASCQIPSYLILEGRNRLFRETDFSLQAIQGILISISIAFRIPVLKTKNTKETVQVMLQSYKQLTKEGLDDQRFFPRPAFFKKKKDPMLSQKVHILEGFPGIGADKAEKLLMKFGNLHAVFTAKEEEFLQVPGFGKKTVDRLKEVLHK
ncbi:ERCC4 domain-containing protein [Pleomorphovibrio marinus]|uniref:ERCC4 domain-containing protein n=1 Tax=Pleomorphovibrio marinus TaxID=2164132 RepID=UPI000E0A3937|nr:ERCC4 domain-containing protein [Pleomorphovibrio marinus]